MSLDHERLFEQYYGEWKSYIHSPHVSEVSSDTAYIDNEYFRKITDLGEQALPYIIEKLKKDPDAHFLIHAMEKITGRGFSQSEVEEGIRKYGSPLGNQGLAKMWIDWWEKEGKTDQKSKADR